MSAQVNSQEAALADSRKLPAVDISNFEARKADVVQQLMSAARTGFFYITGHGIDQGIIDRAFDLNRKFIMLPEKVKKTAVGKHAWQSRGFRPGWSKEASSTASLREAFTAGVPHNFIGQAQEGCWPEQHVPGHRQAWEEMCWANQVVCDLVLRAFALGLNLPEDFFREETDYMAADSLGAMSYNYYPPTEAGLPPDTLRFFPHCDYGLVTLLHSRPLEATGLQVCPGKDVTSSSDGGFSFSEWQDMVPLPGAVVCNLGDALQYMTDGALKAVFHRVRYTKPGEYQGERESLAFFSNVRDRTVIQGPNKTYKPIKFSDIMAGVKAFDANAPPEDLSPEEYAKRVGSYIPQSGGVVHAAQAGGSGKGQAH